MTEETGYYQQLRAWGLERIDGGTERHGKFRRGKGPAWIWIRLPRGLAPEQMLQELRLTAKQYGFEPPDG